MSKFKYLDTIKRDRVESIGYHYELLSGQRGQTNHYKCANQKYGCQTIVEIKEEKDDKGNSKVKCFLLGEHITMCIQDSRKNLDEEREDIKKARKNWYKSMPEGCETVKLFKVELEKMDGRTSAVDGIRKAKKAGEYDLKVIVQIPSSGIFHNEIMEELSDAGSKMSLCVFGEDKYYFMNFIE